MLSRRSATGLYEESIVSERLPPTTTFSKNTWSYRSCSRHLLRTLIECGNTDDMGGYGIYDGYAFGRIPTR
ncbi:hypothetical protein VTL71DRAFT_16020 [Oculimacula yallundae]|uniref:Uncharacterized protein n=1 Tax=Oculimacula yallundae TaxID=86028 RepID=A0ABR4CEH6_9HELO